MWLEFFTFINFTLLCLPHLLTSFAIRSTLGLVAISIFLINHEEHHPGIPRQKV
jgi:hypothetical protein